MAGNTYLSRDGVFHNMIYNLSVLSPHRIDQDTIFSKSTKNINDTTEGMSAEECYLEVRNIASKKGHRHWCL